MLTAPLYRLLRLLVWLGAGLMVLSALAVVALRWLEPPGSAFMLQHESAGHWQGEALYRWTPLAAIAPAITQAVVAAEDQKFPRHWGFDLPSAPAAWAHYKAGGQMRGGSTLSQQVAKNLFLWPGRNLVRKGIEAYLTVLIEIFWPKTRILEMYLNIAEFGAGIYGVGAASEQFFGKPASALTDAEAALLVAVLPNPRERLVQSPSDEVLKRQSWILAQMEKINPVQIAATQESSREER